MKFKFKNELKYLTGGEKDNTMVELQKFYKCQTQKGLKYSSKRTKIIEYFIKADRHFTVEQLYDEIKKIDPKIGYSTVYRTLKLLVGCGLANIHRFGEEEAKFELIHKQQHHDHLVCTRCGRIIEFKHDGIEKFQKDVARRHNFLVNNHELQIFGLCEDCQKQEVRKRREK